MLIPIFTHCLTHSPTYLQSLLTYNITTSFSSFEIRSNPQTSFLIIFQFPEPFTSVHFRAPYSLLVPQIHSFPHVVGLLSPLFPFSVLLPNILRAPYFFAFLPHVPFEVLTANRLTYTVHATLDRRPSHCCACHFDGHHLPDDRSALPHL